LESIKKAMEDLYTSISQKLRMIVQGLISGAI